ncbi:MAG: Rieske 2Fe-2S domain-containing protein [Rubellimicrobium sp.]|nr:Rieske 2Fe-2S domain-containing protein [Rubellimicrobium sp.]
MTGWTDACAEDAIAPEEAMRLDHAGRTYALYRNHEGAWFCTDGLCTHEDVHLAGGLVVENTIECPKHASIFDFATGEVETPPACDNLSTYEVRLVDGRIMVRL